ncbi:MAG TPA: hypothetical protein VN408_40605 [Actinoplanes sp.]|nr:hypothetical protein [Actinoplanes sp.]
MHEVEPQLMRVNGQELGRVVKLLEAALPVLTGIPSTLVWESGAGDLYRQRLHEAETLTHELREGFTLANGTLLRYADALTEAKREMIRADAAGRRLGELIDGLVVTQSVRVRESEPLSQWEDLRATTGFLDRLAEQDIRDRVDAIRPEADRLYYEAASAYTNVRDIELAAREECVTGMQEAYLRLPDFRADSGAAKTIIGTAPGVLAEINEAAAVNTGSRLTGQGAVPPFPPSGIHEDIRQRVRATSGPMPGEWDPASAVYGRYLDPDHEQRYKMAWIGTQQDLIQASAAEYGIPAELLAGIVYQEAGGKPPIADHLADWARRHGLDGKDADDTSFGLMGIQVDTAAVALGYDPAHLSDSQRSEIVASLDDPRQSIVIAAKVLGDAKDASTFSGTDPVHMTFDQQKELAARYNGGPDWDKPIAQGYAGDFASARYDVNRVLYGD